MTGINEGTSLQGASAAVWAAEKSASRIESWRWILSPFGKLVFLVRLVEGAAGGGGKKGGSTQVGYHVKSNLTRTEMVNDLREGLEGSIGTD